MKSQSQRYNTSSSYRYFDNVRVANRHLPKNISMDGGQNHRQMGVDRESRVVGGSPPPTMLISKHMCDFSGQNSRLVDK